MAETLAISDLILKRLNNTAPVKCHDWEVSEVLIPRHSLSHTRKGVRKVTPQFPYRSGCQT